MSAFSSLFGTPTAKDSDLDAVLSKSVAAPTESKRLFKPAASASTSTKAAPAIKPPEEIIKAAKNAKLKSRNKPEGGATSTGKKDKKSKKAKGKAAAVAADPEDSDDDDTAEQNYAAKKQQPTKAGPIVDAGELLQAEADTDEEGDSGSEQELVHETVLAARKAAAAAGKPSTGEGRQQQKRGREDESPADRDARTTFLGNVPVGAVTDKTMKKNLIKHLISTLPTTEDKSKDYSSLLKLDTIRFRSVAFNAPVPKASGTKQPAEAVETEGDGDIDGEDAENHARKRARRWRDHEDDDEEGGAENAQKKQRFLTAGQKRKVAAIKGDVHGKAKSCNAYVVWQSKDESAVSSRALASLVVKHANNTVFEGLTIRVDHVRSSTSLIAPSGVVDSAAANGAASEDTAAKKALAAEHKQKAEEEKRTLYLGSLDFEETEQAVRDLCERLIKEEKGEPPASSPWVERVRVIKDSETGLGKGFAYVLFKNRECVDEMLAMEATRVRLSKRKLRMERCQSASAKQAAAKKLATAQAAQRDAASSRDARKKDRVNGRDANRTPIGSGARPAPVAAVKLTPRPDIGDTLSGLSKEERKSLKTADEGRLARRMAKKQNVRAGIREEKQKEVLDKKLKKTAQGGSADRKRPGANERAKKTRTKSDSALRKQNRKKGAD